MTQGNSDDTVNDGNDGENISSDDQSYISVEKSTNKSTSGMGFHVISGYS